MVIPAMARRTAYSHDFRSIRQVSRRDAPTSPAEELGQRAAFSARAHEMRTRAFARDETGRHGERTMECESPANSALLATH